MKTYLAQYRDELGIHLANFSDLVEIIEADTIIENDSNPRLLVFHDLNRHEFCYIHEGIFISAPDMHTFDYSEAVTALKAGFSDAESYKRSLVKVPPVATPRPVKAKAIPKLIPTSDGDDDWEDDVQGQRSPNDNRSDSMNPNNSSCKAAADNRSNQMNPNNWRHGR